MQLIQINEDSADRLKNNYFVNFLNPIKDIIDIDVNSFMTIITEKDIYYANDVIFHTENNRYKVHPLKWHTWWVDNTHYLLSMTDEEKTILTLNNFLN